MNFLSRLKIGTRLASGFAIVLGLSVLVGILSVTRLAKVNDSTTELATNWLVAMRALGEYGLDVATIRRAEASTVMSGKADVIAAQTKRAEDLKARAADRWNAYVATVTAPEERKLAADIQAGQQRYYGGLAKVLAVAPTDPDAREKAVALFEGESKAGFDQMMSALRTDVEFQTKGGDQAYREAQGIYGQARITIVGLLVAAVALGATLAWLITRSITRPLAQALEVAETVAGGNLSSRIDSTSADETGQLLRALRHMNESLVRIVSQVRHTSDSIATGSSQIAAGNADLSQRTEEQASNLQQTAASMEQLTSTVKQNADTARMATQLANGASQAAAVGGQVVGRVVATMEEITKSSRKIVDIIGVIDGIAFQTNILALNAAVEAARAGEQGRGFAVVASEVRNLAQRSAAAAKEIKSLISASVENVESGTRLVDEAGQSMSDIVSQVSRVNDLIGEISAASLEQSTGIGQIGDAVNQLDQVTQQNAALVEESAAAAESLKVQAGQLAQMVSVFKLGTDGEAPAPEHVAARPAGVRSVPAALIKRAAAGDANGPASSGAERSTSGVNRNTVPEPSQAWEQF